MAIVVIGSIIKALIAVGRWFGEAGRAVGNFAKAVAEGIAKAIRWVDDIGDRVNAAVRGFGTLLVHAGEELIQGLIDGITHKLGELGSKMSEVAKKVKGFLPGSPVAEGPLTAWNRKSPGETLVERIAEGLQPGPVERGMTRVAAAVRLGQGPAAGAGGAPGALGGLGGGRLRLVVDGYEFNAYVDNRADNRVASARDLDDQRGRAAWA